MLMFMHICDWALRLEYQHFSQPPDVINSFFRLYLYVEYVFTYEFLIHVIKTRVFNEICMLVFTSPAVHMHS